MSGWFVDKAGNTVTHDSGLVVRFTWVDGVGWEGRCVFDAKWCAGRPITEIQPEMERFTKEAARIWRECL